MAMDAGAETKRMGECEHAWKVFGVVQSLLDERHLLGIIPQTNLRVAVHDIGIEPDELPGRSSRQEN